MEESNVRLDEPSNRDNGIYAANANTADLLEDNIDNEHKTENMESVDENIGNKYVTPSPTFLHAHPYYEKAYLRATKSGRRITGGISLGNYGQNIYALKRASMNMASIGYTLRNSETPSYSHDEIDDNKFVLPRPALSFYLSKFHSKL